MKAARGRVTLSDSSDTFSGMWRIRSKLRSRASFFSIRRARSATAGLTETRERVWGRRAQALVSRRVKRECSWWRAGCGSAVAGCSGHAHPRRGRGFLVTQSAVGDRLATVYDDPYRALCPVSRCLMSHPAPSGACTAATCEKTVSCRRETWCTRFARGVARLCRGRWMVTARGRVSMKDWVPHDRQLACSRARTDLQRSTSLLRSSVIRVLSPSESASTASATSATEWSSLSCSSLSRCGRPP